MARTHRQHTAGPAAHYPLYYYIPSHSADGRYMVVHRMEDRDVQLVRLDLCTGVTVPITHGQTREAGWGMWCEEGLTGVYNHLSALNVVRSEVLWFQDAADQLELCAASLESREPRVVKRWEDVMPIGQGAVSPDGRTFVTVVANRAMYRSALTRHDWTEHEAWRRSVPCSIVEIDLDTGSCRTVIDLEYHVHHVIFADAEHLLVNHLNDGNGMWSVHVSGDPATIRKLRPENANGRVCHQVVTKRGIYFEAFRSFTGNHESWIGRYDWPGESWTETPLDVGGYSHTGFDPAGDLAVFEVSGEQHLLLALKHPGTVEVQTEVLRALPPYPGRGQIYHAHPFFGPDANTLYFTEIADGRSQVCSLDVSDIRANPDYDWK